MSEEPETWLLAQLAEADNLADEVHDFGCNYMRVGDDPDGWCTCSTPAALRADIAAKRRIVELCVEAAYCRECGVSYHVIMQLLRLFADRPGYNPGWVVDEP